MRIGDISRKAEKMSVTALIIYLAVMFFGTIGVCIYFFTYKPKKSRNATRDRLGLMYVADVKHKSGLPFPSGLTIRVGYGAKGFVFIGDRTDVSVSMDKVVDVDYFLSTSKGTVTRGAAHGRRLYGKNHKTLGTLAGAAMVSHYHLVVSYEADNKIKKVVLDAEAGNVDCQRMQKHYKSNNFKPKRTIDLSPSHSSKPNTNKASATVLPQNSGCPLGESLDAAIRYAIEVGSISTSALQRKIKIGFASAARIVDYLCNWGVISSESGAKPKEVLITLEQYEKISQKIRKVVKIEDLSEIDASVMFS